MNGSDPYGLGDGDLCDSDGDGVMDGRMNGGRCISGGGIQTPEIVVTAPRPQGPTVETLTFQVGMWDPASYSATGPAGAAYQGLGDDPGPIEKKIADLLPASIIPFGQCVDKYTSDVLGIGVLVDPVYNTAVGFKSEFSRAAGASTRWTSWEHQAGYAMRQAGLITKAGERVLTGIGRATAVAVTAVGSYDWTIIIQCAAGRIN
jgi:hypothetical protein